VGCRATREEVRSETAKLDPVLNEELGRNREDSSKREAGASESVTEPAFESEYMEVKTVYMHETRLMVSLTHAMSATGVCMYSWKAR
jgi:hypothetical protein